MSIIQAAIIGSAANNPLSGYPVPGSGTYDVTFGDGSLMGTPYDPGSSQGSVDHSAYGFYRRTVNGEWNTGNYTTTDMTFFDNKTVTERLADTYVSFGVQGDVNSYYSMYWLGYFQAPETGTYNISINSDDTSMVWIGSNAISGFTGSNCVVTAGNTTANSLSLTGGQWYPIRVWYDEHGGNNSCQLFIGQTGNILHNMHYWYQQNRIVYDTVTKGLNAPVYSVGPAAYSVNEGSALTFNVNTLGVQDGTTLYWTIHNITTSDADFSAVSGSVSVTNQAGSFTVTPLADQLTEGPETFGVDLRTGSISGPIVWTSNSATINDTSLTRPHWSNGDATATGRSYSYRYYKWNITKTRSNPFLGSTQISELIILNGGTRLTGGTATNPNGDNNTGEEASKALDGYYDNKWCDKNYSTNGNTSTIIVDLGSAQISNGFTFATANDYDNRDPVQWTFEGSNDGSTWEILQQQITDASITTNRSTLVSTVFNYPVHGSLTFDGWQDYVRVGRTSLSVTATTSSGNATLPGDVSGSYVYCVNAALAAQVGDTFTADGQTCTIAEVRSVADNMIFIGFTPRITAGAINSSDTLVFNPIQPFGMGTTWTIEFWSNAAQASTTALYPIMCQYPSNGSIDITLSSGYLRFADELFSVPEPTPNVWTHVAIVSNSGTFGVYYNGVSQTITGSGSYILTDTGYNLYIGTRGYGEYLQYFVGKLTNITINNTAKYTEDFSPVILPGTASTLRYQPTDQNQTLDLTCPLPMTLFNQTAFSSDYPLLPAIAGNTITSTVTGDSGTYELTYTNTGGTITLITVKDAPTLGSISIVGTSLYYIAPCWQGDYINDKIGWSHTGSEIDTFSLYLHGVGGGRTQVPVSVTINAS